MSDLQVFVTRIESGLSVRALVPAALERTILWPLLSTASDWYQNNATPWRHSDEGDSKVVTRELFGPWVGDAIHFWVRRAPHELGWHKLWADTPEQGRDSLDPKQVPLFPIDWHVDGALVSAESVAALVTPPEREYALGTLTLSSPVVRVSDPCYEKNTWCTGTFEVKPGVWHASLLMGPTSWLQRVKQLRIRLDAAPASVFEDLAAFETVPGLSAGVDSGQCGFFEDSLYPAFTEVQACELNDLAGQLTLDRMLPGGGVLVGEVGVVSQSGLGDGSYGVRVFKDKAGDVVAAYLSYLPVEGEGDDSEYGE